MGFEYSENRIGTLASYEDVKSAQNMREAAALLDAQRSADNTLNELYAAAQPQPVANVESYTQPVEAAPAPQYSAEQQAGISDILTNAADWLSFARADATSRKVG